MRLSEKIKFETYIAFIHSRLIGLGGDKNGPSEAVVEDKELVKKINSKCKYLAGQLSEISTIEKINYKIENSQSDLISKMYYDNYSILHDLLESRIKRGGEIIEGVLGLSMLMSLLENKKIIDIKLEELQEVMDIFKNHSEGNRALVSKMIRLSFYISSEYSKKTRINSKRKKK